MIKVNKSINLKQLDVELNNLGLIATSNEDKQIIEVGLAENNTATEAELKTAIDAHVAVDEAQARAEAKAAAQAKLAALGLTVEDLQALGL
jgi:hypothetical protein